MVFVIVFLISLSRIIHVASRIGPCRWKWHYITTLYISYMKLCAHFISEKGIFHISYVKIEVHISYMKVVEFSIFHIWKQAHWKVELSIFYIWKESCIFLLWKWQSFLYFIYEQGSAYFIYESGKISFTSYMKIEQLNKVWSLLFMIGWDCVLFAVRTFRPDLVLSALGHGDPVTGLASVWKLRACVWASVLRCLGSGWVGFSGSHALLWVGLPGPPGGQCCGRAPSLSPAGFTLPGAPGDPSGGQLLLLLSRFCCVQLCVTP